MHTLNIQLCGNMPSEEVEKIIPKTYHVEIQQIKKRVILKVTRGKNGKN